MRRRSSQKTRLMTIFKMMWRSPWKSVPDHVVEELHADQGGAEVQVHVLNPRQPVVPTPGELRLADGESTSTASRKTACGPPTSQRFKAAVDHNRGEWTGFGGGS